MKLITRDSFKPIFLGFFLLFLFNGATSISAQEERPIWIEYRENLTKDVKVIKYLLKKQGIPPFFIKEFVLKRNAHCHQPINQQVMMHLCLMERKKIQILKYTRKKFLRHFKPFISKNS